MINEMNCPLCQSQNLCGIKEKEACWCSKTEVPNDLLKKLPDEYKNKACICQKCIEQFQSAKFTKIN